MKKRSYARGARWTTVLAATVLAGALIAADLPEPTSVEDIGKEIRTMARVLEETLERNDLMGGSQVVILSGHAYSLQSCCGSRSSEYCPGGYRRSISASSLSSARQRARRRASLRSLRISETS